MPKEPNAKDLRKGYLKDWISYLMQGEVLSSIKKLETAAFVEPETALTPLRAEAENIWKEGGGVTLARLCDILNQTRGSPSCPRELRDSIEHFFTCKRATALPRVPHEEKRKIAAALGFFNKPYYLADLLSGKQTADTVPGFTMREKMRSFNHGIPQRRYLSEVVDGNAIVTNAETGYDVVDVDQSVIYFSRGDDGKITIELVVLRNVAGSARFADVLFKWIYKVILNSCTNRTNIRPRDEGTMTQLGLNMGARHLRAIGLASSFKKLKRIDQDTKESDDKDAVGVISLAWGIMEKIMPQEVIDISYQRLAQFNLPELETRNLPSGGGYTVKIGDEEVTFPTARRAPPEGYLSDGYEARTHIDEVYSPYTFTFNVAREIVVKRDVPESSYQTRSATNKIAGELKSEVEGPMNGGSSFVDITLRVVVRQGPGTMMAIRPQFIHGTSKGYGAKNSGITISFSERIIEAWEIAKEGGVTIKEFQNTDGE